MSYEVKYCDQTILYKKTKEQKYGRSNVTMSIYLTIGVLLAHFIGTGLLHYVFKEIMNTQDAVMDVVTEQINSVGDDQD